MNGIKTIWARVTSKRDQIVIIGPVTLAKVPDVANALRTMGVSAHDLRRM